MRKQVILTDGWFVKQIDTDEPDAVALTREAAAPNDTWLRFVTFDFSTQIKALT